MRIKVVWICHFVSKEISDKLGLKRRPAEMAPWIINLIDLFQEYENELDLYIISPYQWLKKAVKFDYKGAHLYFFNAGMPFSGRRWPKILKFDYFTNFYFNQREILKLIRLIKPDIVHLHGAENAYYASSFLKIINDYPHLVTIQGFIRNASTTNAIKHLQRIKIEENILRNATNFGIRAAFMQDFILLFNQTASFHWHNYPITMPNEIKSTEKNYDIVFFGRVCKNKGIEDLIKAAAMIKIRIKNLQIKVIGGIAPQYHRHLVAITEKLKVEQHFEFVGFLPSQLDVFNLAAKAKISVLPTHADIIPGTVIESMLLKLPMVAYEVGGLPDLNADGNENIILIKKGDISALAERITKLLEDPSSRDQLALNGYRRACELYDNKKIFPSLIPIYKSIIDDYKK